MRTGQTHGGALSRRFCWGWDGAALCIHRQNGWRDEFPVAELAEILRSLEEQFRSGWFPLANDVEKMWNGREKPGLGMTILSIRPNDRRHAQAGGYLAVVLEHRELATWNGKSKGIEWRLNGKAPTVEELAARLQEGTCR